MRSPNLLTEPDPTKLRWQLLPDNDHGLPPPAIFDPNTTVMEEGKLLPLPGSKGFYAMARTDRGVLASSSTTDKTAAAGWAPTSLARYWDPRRCRCVRAAVRALSASLRTLRALIGESCC